MTRRLREVAILLIGALALFVLISLATFDRNDPGWSLASGAQLTRNAGGPVGAWLADVLFFLFGLLAFLFPVMIAWSGWLIFKQRNDDDSVNIHLVALRWAGFVLTIAAGCALAAASSGDFGLGLPEGAGGITGKFIHGELLGAVSWAGSALFLIAVFLGGVTLFTGISWLTVMEAIGGSILTSYRVIARRFAQREERAEAKDLKKQRAVAVKEEKVRKKLRKPVKIEPTLKSVEPSERVDRERQVPLFDVEVTGDVPPLALLDQAKPSGKGYSDEELEALSRLVELKLQDFRIQAEVTAVHPGPVVTLFELQLSPGTKASKVTNIARDLARALSTISVRVVEVIPGKSVIGLEIPNEHREMVYLSETLQSREYDEARSPLTIGLGKDIAGNPVVADLGKMPHGLIAGTTGSGKSVAINAVILSLLFKATPDQVRLIMIDPKMLELSVYEGIPHLLTPVVTDMKEAANALRWCVGEMERRYKLMAALGVRNIAGYNRKVLEAEKAGEPLKDPLFVQDPTATELLEHPTLTTLPYIVVIIDELADMMMVVGKKVEELIARLAQKARAAGIHLLLATQRPSVDVITGLIKANIPTRLAFQVSSRIDSRTILDQMGAEQLLGHGDSLYLPPGGSIPQRVHGAFVDDHEVHAVVEYLKQTGKPEYIEDIVQEPTEAIPGLNDGVGASDVENSDPLFDEAVRIVTESRRASISSVQRRLKVGYNRAARLIEEMERVGIVSPPEHNGNREVLAPPPPEL
ncbi:MAG TPA: DNA translocase FtsK [Chromatiaceae bacterium]|nr:DNA translocase FtsK [Chromatiaceae bacterium]